MTPYETTLIRAAESNPNLIVMTAENRAFLRNVGDAFGNRLIDVGICEQNMFGVAAGLAMSGKTVITHALATFISMRPFEMIRSLVAFPKRDIKIIAAFSGVLSEANGFMHQAVEDIALMRTLPDVVVLSPAGNAEMGAAIETALATDGPVYIRYNHIPEAGTELLAPHEAAVEPAAESSTTCEPIEIGRYRELRSGTAGYFVVHGILTRHVVAAAAALAESGIDMGILYAPAVLPIDADAITTAANRTGRIIIVEDQCARGGLTDAVNGILVAAGMKAGVAHFGIGERGFATGLLADVLRHEKLNADGLSEQTRELLNSP